MAEDRLTGGNVAIKKIMDVVADGAKLSDTMCAWPSVWACLLFSDMCLCLCPTLLSTPHSVALLEYVCVRSPLPGAFSGRSSS
jgi:hypothetical protein